MKKLTRPVEYDGKGTITYWIDNKMFECRVQPAMGEYIVGMPKAFAEAANGVKDMLDLTIRYKQEIEEAFAKLHRLDSAVKQRVKNFRKS